MAQMHGKQSQYLLKISKLNKIAYFFIIFLIVIFFIFLFKKDILQKISGWVLIIIIASPLFFYLYKEFYIYWLKSRQYITGSRGEGAIWYELKKLSNDYAVFQDLKFKKIGNIDFVIVGPSGIFTIDVKSHNGSIDIKNGKLIRDNYDLEKDFLKQAKGEALILHDHLKEHIINLPRDFFIKPILVFSNRWASMKFGEHPIESVFVIKKSWLNKIIYKQKSLLEKETLELIKENLKSYLDKQNNITTV